MTDNLKPCPFDGGQPVLEHKPHGTDTAYYLRCKSCAAEGPWAKTENGAKRWWNMRDAANSGDRTPAKGFGETVEQVARAICAAYGDDYDEQPKDMTDLETIRQRERGPKYDGIHPHDPGLPTQADWITCAVAALEVMELIAMFGGTFHAFEEWLATRPDLKTAGTAQQLDEYERCEIRAKFAQWVPTWTQNLWNSHKTRSRQDTVGPNTT